ncbi:phosphatase PAP2/dual specificity phosphatase family protein [Psychrobacter sp. T6-1]|uniref:phosphatase PAP2/dual specificity phosphatase family protein n=1 Tax=Psychrobacter sp. T6-1 TaxID=3457447 RepID=UPI003FD09A54
MSLNKVQKKTRRLSLTIALGLFALLYTVTNFYAQTLFDDIQQHLTFSLVPKTIYELSVPLDTFIPFIPVMIVPYSWSILLFCASFFVVKTPWQLSLLTRRLILATVLGCLIFYLFPARFSFVRPLPTDWTRFGYQFLGLTDKPFNQLPSLHVAYALVLGATLWEVYRSVIYRALLFVVCSLIIVSTVFTYQHHVLDIIGGCLLAASVIWLANNLRNNLVLKYVAVAVSGFILLSVLGYLLSRQRNEFIEIICLLLAGYWLMSFLSLAWLYQYPNHVKKWFKKDKQGRLNAQAWVAFAPVLSGYYLMWYVVQRYSVYPQKAKQTPHHLSEYKCIYSVASAKVLNVLSHNLYSALDSQTVIIVDCAVEANSHYSPAKKALTDHTNANLCYLYFPILDLQSFVDIDSDEMIELFKQIKKIEADKALASETGVVIHFHCIMGFSRSIALQVLYLVYCQVLTVDNYRDWIATTYPKAHVSEDYLPLSVVKNISIKTDPSRHHIVGV